MDLVGSMEKDSVRLRRIAYHWGGRGEKVVKDCGKKCLPNINRVKVSVISGMLSKRSLIQENINLWASSKDKPITLKIRLRRIERWNNTLRQRVGSASGG